MSGPSLTLHASAVTAHGRGLLILGSAGAGKTTLAVEMIALGARLIADDRTEVANGAEGLKLSAPQALSGLVELRGIGLIRLPALASAPLAFAVDLDHEAGSRLPEPGVLPLLDTAVPRIFGKGRAGLAPALMALLQAGALLPQDFRPDHGEPEGSC